MCVGGWDGDSQPLGLAGARCCVARHPAATPFVDFWSNVRSSPIGHNGVSQVKGAISAAGDSGTADTLMRTEQRQEQQVLYALAM